MFKFDPKQALELQDLNKQAISWVRPYKEGDNEQKWVVKCIDITKHEEINDTLQNLFLQNSSNSGGLLPVMGYDVQKNEHGHSKIYMRMPRMKESLSDIIHEYRYSLQNPIPLEKIVQYLYSIASTLDDLAEKKIFHRNLKPTNVLVDKEGNVYLSDLKSNQSSRNSLDQEEDKNLTPTPGNDNVDSTENNYSLYKAPELYSSNLAPTDREICKSDVWSLGMIIAEACLMDKLQYTPPEFPLQDQIETAQHNIAEIQNKYGEKFSKVMGSVLEVSQSQRNTFKEICENLEESFAEMIVPKMEMSRVSSKSSKSKTNSRMFYSDYSIDNEIFESPFLQEEDEISHRQGFMLDLSQSRDFLDRSEIFSDNRQSFYRRALRFKNSIQLKMNQIFDKPIKLKDVTRSPICTLMIATIAIIVFFYVSTSISQRKNAKYFKVIRGLEAKYSDQYKLNLDGSNTGSLIVESFGDYHKAEYRNDHNPEGSPPMDHWKEMREMTLHNLIHDLASELEYQDVVEYLSDLKISLSENAKITDRSLQMIGTALRRLKGLKGFSFENISGPFTDQGMNSFLSYFLKDFKDLEKLSIGFSRGKVPEEEMSLSIDGLYPLANQILKKLKKLTTFNLSFDKMDIITDLFLTQLADHLNQHGENIIAFDLKLDWCKKITAEGIKSFHSKFLNNMRSLTDLGVSYKGTHIESEGLKSLTSSINEKGQNLQVLRIGIENTNINAAHLKKSISLFKEKPPKLLQHLLLQTSIWEKESLEKVREDLNFIPEVIILPQL